MDYSKYKELKITTKDRILTITINRPDDMNAVNEQLHADFSTIFLDAEYDEIKEEKRRVIQEIAHDDINSENLT